MADQPKTIEVTIRTVYGVEQIYPVCPRAKVFASIAGTKTLSLPTIGNIRELGYEIIHRKAESKLEATLRGKKA